MPTLRGGVIYWLAHQPKGHSQGDEPHPIPTGLVNARLYPVVWQRQPMRGRAGTKPLA